MATMVEIFNEISRERMAQDAKWGGPAHDDQHSHADWRAFIYDHTDRAVEGRKHERYRYQMIRVAALAIAAIQSFDRKKGNGCRYCDEGNPRVPSSVSDKFVHTDTPMGRVVCTKGE